MPLLQVWYLVTKVPKSDLILAMRYLRSFAMRCPAYLLLLKDHLAARPTVKLALGAVQLLTITWLIVQTPNKPPKYNDFRHVDRCDEV